VLVATVSSRGLLRFSVVKCCERLDVVLCMNILLIDDDAELVAVLTLALERAGFGVWTAQDAPTALARLDTEPPDLIVLNIPPQTRPALDLLRQLRQRSQTAVIMLTGRGDEDARVMGLEQGADDYVTKPFSPRELVARIGAILQHHAPNTATPPAPLTVGPLTLDEASHTVTNAGQPLVLTPLEFRLLHYLMSHAGTVVPFVTLIRQVWGYDDPTATDVVRTSVYRLRRKLGDDPAEPHLLQSVPSVGFLLSDVPSPPAPGEG
jgi:DNA-binding response OmpR family regulator